VPRQANIERKLARAGDLAVLVLLLLLCGQVSAQSGRRSSKTTIPAVTPEKAQTNNDSSTTAKSSDKETTTRIKLLVARQPTTKHLSSEDKIYASFIKRLNDFSGIASTALGDLKREQAVERAKVQTDAFVVLLKFEVDNYQRGTVILDSPDLELKYFVFAPRTGQQKTKGKVYYQAIGGLRIRKEDWPQGPAIKITEEAAGIEVANRLHDWLSLLPMTK